MSADGGQAAALRYRPSRRVWIRIQQGVPSSECRRTGQRVPLADQDLQFQSAPTSVAHSLYVPSPTHVNRLRYLVQAGVISCTRGVKTAGLALLFRLPHRCVIAGGARGNKKNRQYEG